MPIILQRIYRKIDDFWFRKESTISLDTFRLVFGCFLTLIMLLSFLNWQRFYGTDSILPYDYFVESRGGFLKAAFKSIFAWSDAAWFVWGVYGVGLLAAITFTLGFKTKVSTIVLYLVWFSMCNRNNIIIDGKDAVIKMLLFYSCFAPLGTSLSLDCFFKKHNWDLLSFERKSVWSLRLMQISIALIYPFTALDKLRNDAAWVDGSVIYYVTLYDGWFRFTDINFLHNHLLSIVATYGTLLTEFLFPILVWFKQTRAIALVAVTLLHLSIAILMNQYILQFSLVMLISFILFIEPATFRKFFIKVQIRSVESQKTEIKNAPNSVR